MCNLETCQWSCTFRKGSAGNMNLLRTMALPDDKVLTVPICMYRSGETKHNNLFSYTVLLRLKYLLLPKARRRSST